MGLLGDRLLVPTLPGVRVRSFKQGGVGAGGKAWSSVALGQAGNWGMFRNCTPRPSPTPCWLLKAARNQEAAAVFQQGGGVGGWRGNYVLLGVIACFLSPLWSLLAPNSSVKFGSENQESVQRGVLFKALKHFFE